MLHRQKELDIKVFQIVMQPNITLKDEFETTGKNASEVTLELVLFTAIFLSEAENKKTTG